MADPNPDDPAPPGSRIWRGDMPNQKIAAGRERWEGQRNWLNRAPANGRHAAITGSLHSWTSYKSWADRVKNTWDKDK